MTTITQYVADDGTVFDEEGECFKYEKTMALKAYAGKILLFDKKANQLPLTAQEDTVAAIFVEDEDAARVLQEVWRWDDYGTPWDYSCYYNRKSDTYQLGAFVYDYENGNWVSLNEFLEQYRYFQDIATAIANIRGSH